MQVDLVKMGGSPFNASIWRGLSHAFRALGFRVEELDDEALADPSLRPERADLLFVVHGGTVPADWVARYRNANIPTAVYLLDEPYEVDRSTQWARHYDWVFTVDEATVPVHRAFSETRFLPLGYDTSRFGPTGRVYRSDILVLGSPFEHRLRVLAPLREQWGKHTTWVGPGWRPFCSHGRHVEQLVSPEVCARFYRGAGIVLNIHRDSVWSHYGDRNSAHLEATHLNPRFWEATACGAFQLTSYRSDVERFAPEAVTFETAGELSEKLDAYWSDASERRRIAVELQKGVHAHSYVCRAQRIVEEMKLGHPTHP